MYQESISVVHLLFLVILKIFRLICYDAFWSILLMLHTSSDNLIIMWRAKNLVLLKEKNINLFSKKILN